MIFKNYTSWLLTFFCGLVIMSFYFALKSKELLDSTIIQDALIDISVMDLSVKQFDKHGNEQHYLHSPVVQHIPLKQQHILQQPHIVLTANNEPSWEISADSATAVEKAQKITFNKNVVIARAKSKNIISPSKNDDFIMHADQAIFKQKTHLGNYTGNINITHGETKIQSDSAKTLGNDNNSLKYVEFKGSKNHQAHYITSVPKKPQVNAYADVMKYYQDRHIIQFIGNARLTQGNDFFAAPMIVYDTLSQHIVSSSKGVVRTTIVIHPENYS